MPEVLSLSSMADAEPDLSTFENKTGLAEDMKFLASMPELCDVTFLVGDTREPVCAVKVRLHIPLLLLLLLHDTHAHTIIVCSHSTKYDFMNCYLFIFRLYWRLGLGYSRKCCIRHRLRNERKSHLLVRTSYDCFWSGHQSHCSIYKMLLNRYNLIALFSNFFL